LNDLEFYRSVSVRARHSREQRALRVRGSRELANGIGVSAEKAAIPNAPRGRILGVVPGGRYA
jgi:hypothetical protein